MVQDVFRSPGAEALGPRVSNPGSRAAAVETVAEALRGTGEVWLLSGPSGPGRTGLVNDAVAQLPGPPARVVRVAAEAGPAKLDLKGFVTQAAGQTGPEASGDALERVFDLFAGDEPILLVIDGADLLTVEALRYVQLLSQSSPGLQVLLAAAPGFRAVLDGYPHLRARLGPELTVPVLPAEDAGGRPAPAPPAPARLVAAPAAPREPTGSPSVPADPAPPGPPAKRWMGVLTAAAVLAAAGLGGWAVLTRRAAPEPPPVPAQSSPPVEAARPPAPPSAPAPPPAPAAPVQEAARPAPPPTPQPVAPELLVALLSRGEAMLAAGDVSAARLLFERAASGGSGSALLAAGRAYDPGVLAELGVVGIKPDPAQAAEYYRRAAALGNADARRMLERLGAGNARR